MLASLWPVVGGLVAEDGMHIPDGFVSLPIALAFWVVCVFAVRLAVRRVSRALEERMVPLMGVLAAFIFAAQMINFPIAGATSGHLVGGALAAVVLGPWAAILVMTAVVGLQALLFQDGGLLAMGANIVNMGVVPALVGFGLARSVSGRSVGVKTLAAGAAGWLSVMSAALLASLALWLSNTAALRLVVPAMLSVHAVIGLGEAAITMAALGLIAGARPDLVDRRRVETSGGRAWVAGAAIVIGLVLVLAPFASVHPDGLERVAEDLGFAAVAAPSPYSILPDYTLPFLGQTGQSTVVAGLVGVVLVAIIVGIPVRRLVTRAPTGR